MTNGLTIRPGESVPISLSPIGTTRFNTFYLDAANNGDDVEWLVLLYP